MNGALQFRNGSHLLSDGKKTPICATTVVFENDSLILHVYECDILAASFPLAHASVWRQR